MQYTYIPIDGRRFEQRQMMLHLLPEVHLRRRVRARGAQCWTADVASTATCQCCAGVVVDGGTGVATTVAIAKIVVHVTASAATTASTTGNRVVARAHTTATRTTAITLRHRATQLMMLAAHHNVGRVVQGGGGRCERLVRMMRMIDIVRQGNRLWPLVEHRRVRCRLMVTTDIVPVVQMHTTMAIEFRFWWRSFAKLGPQSFVRRLDTLATFLYLQENR